MQPEITPGQRPVEQAPSPQTESYEIPPNFTSPEIESGSSAERLEQRSAVELAPPPPAAIPAPMPPVVPIDTPGQAPAMTSQPVQNPVAANDDDTIEKEWVDRAKQVIAQTKDNPYAREKAIGELQRDYLMKRYGRQVGANND